MNKKLSIITLGISISSIIVLGLWIGYKNPKNELVNIYGNQSKLGDVSILSEEELGMYTTNKVILSKDNYKVDNNAKQSVKFTNKYSKIFNENREFLTYNNRNNHIYETKDSIGYMDYLDSNYSDEYINFTTTLYEKNLKTNEVTEVKLKLPTKFKETSGNSYDANIAKYKNDIYIVVSGTLDETYNEYGESMDDGVDFTKIYKVNLNDKKAEELDIKLPDNDKYKVEREYTFVEDNKIYFIIRNTVNNNYLLSYYDLENQKIESIENEIILEEPINSYYILAEDNKLNLLYQNENTKDKIELYLTTIDLKTGSKIIDNKAFEMDNINKFNWSRNFRILDNKLYVNIKSYKTNGQYLMPSEVEYADSIAVFDIKSSKLLYVGSYRQNSPAHTGSYILKNNEI